MEICQTNSEMDQLTQVNQTMTSNFSIKTDNIEEMRKQLAETSIQLEENRERFKRSVAKKAKDIEMNYNDVNQFRGDDRKMRVKIN